MATDLTPKAPSVGFVLADVDPKSQPPAGGDAEQVLAKRTSADYDWRWAPPVSLDVDSATVQQALADLVSRYSVKDIIGLTLQGRTLTFTWRDGNDNTRTSQALVPVIRDENQGVDIAAVDARIAEPARTGSTTRWDKSKVPDDVVYIATQRFTQELLAKLNGIEENAGANVQPDWDATSGDAQILNKPTIPVPRTDSEIDARIATEARAGNTDRWTVAKVPTLSDLGGVTPAAASATATTIAHAAALARYTAAEKTKLAGLPAAADLEFDNHPVGTAAALNALSRTTSSLDFVTVTAAISSGITANTVVDSSGTALTSLASGDLLILDHANNRWERVVNLPTTALVSNADIDARILPQARTGNAQTWPVSKVPSLAALGGLTQAQVDLRAAFRFTTLEKTKLAGIPADAERNVKANWDATRGDAEILNKPVIPTLPAAVTKAEAEAGTETGTRLWSPLRVKEAIEQLGGDGMGSSSPADFSIVEGRSGSAVTITTPATAGTVANPQWTSWNAVGTTAAVSASQAGPVLIAAEVRAERTTPVPGGGGDRILTQARIVRTRGSTDTVLATKDIYGPRNVNTASVQTASKSISSTLVWHDTAVAADTYKVEVRCSSQLTSRTVQFNTANNGIFLTAVSGGGGAAAGGEIPGQVSFTQSATDSDNTLTLANVAGVAFDGFDEITPISGTGISSNITWMDMTGAGLYRFKGKIELTSSTLSSVGFSSGGSDKEFEFDVTVTSAQVSLLPVYSETSFDTYYFPSSQTGIRAASSDIFRGSTNLGKVYFIIGRTATDWGYGIYFDSQRNGSAGGTASAATFKVSFAGTFIRSDYTTRMAAIRDGPGSLLNIRDQFLKVNAAGTGLVGASSPLGTWTQILSDTSTSGSIIAGSQWRASQHKTRLLAALNAVAAASRIAGTHAPATIYLSTDDDRVVSPATNLAGRVLVPIQISSSLRASASRAYALVHRYLSPLGERQVRIDIPSGSGATDYITIRWQTPGTDTFLTSRPGLAPSLYYYA